MSKNVLKGDYLLVLERLKLRNKSPAAFDSRRLFSMVVFGMVFQVFEFDAVITIITTHLTTGALVFATPFTHVKANKASPRTN